MDLVQGIGARSAGNNTTVQYSPHVQSSLHSKYKISDILHLPEILFLLIFQLFLLFQIYFFIDENLSRDYFLTEK